MRSAILTLALLGLAPSAWAGVYNLSEQHPGNVGYGAARGFILRLRSAAEAPAGLPHPESFRAQVLRQVNDLERDRAGGVFSHLDRINLSACYLRLGRAGDALVLLLEEDNGHFMYQANLASAYFLTGDLQMAVRTQGRVLAAWPAAWAGWTEEERLFFRECESALLRLFENRYNETQGPKVNEYPVDPIFPRLRYVGPENTYVAGGLSVSMRDRLPSNAGPIIFQLCKWYPGDMRLYWQLGELLNVLGQVEQAGDIFDELVRNGRSGVFLDLPAHRRVLRDALPGYREIQDPKKRGMLLSQLLLIPRPMPGAPVIGEAAYVAGSSAAGIAVPYWSKEPPLEFDKKPNGDENPGRVFEWRHLVGTFAFGFLIAALLGWQVQVSTEKRRKQAAS